jgi:hypothetical protein
MPNQHDPCDLGEWIADLLCCIFWTMAGSIALGLILRFCT